MIGKLIDWMRGETEQEKVLRKEIKRLQFQLEWAQSDFFELAEDFRVRGQRIHQLERRLRKRNRKSARQHTQIYGLNRALRLADAHQLAEISGELWELHAIKEPSHVSR